MLLVVAESSGSSPGRQGYKMALGVDGELIGSIGGGVMEVNLVEQSRTILSGPSEVTDGLDSFISSQIHQKNSPNSSGMICSGRQTVIFQLLKPESSKTVEAIIDRLKDGRPVGLALTLARLAFTDHPADDCRFERTGETDFLYSERLGYKNNLYIIGGGHCSLALSELMSKLDFYIRLFDDRPKLNTIEKNRFAHKITIIEGYDEISDLIDEGTQTFVVVMTLGYISDEIVIRQLLGKEFKYFGVLGSKAKMKTLLDTLRKEGSDPAQLAKIYTPIGLPINSRTPEEIAVSIAAEIIALKNAD